MSATRSIHYRGPFRGGDPRDFLPDSEACTPEQIENWRAFVRIWNAAAAAGETLPPEPAQDSTESSPFGVGYQGTTEIEDSAEGAAIPNGYGYFKPRQNASPEEAEADFCAFLAKTKP